MIITVAILLVVLVRRLFKKYNWEAFLHPALWFSFAWAIALISYFFIDLVGAVPIKNSKLLNELMILLMVTGIAFLVFTAIPLSSRQSRPKSINPTSVILAPYTLFALVGLAGALINWIGLGAAFAYNDDIRQQWLYKIPPITAITWYFYFLSYPAAFISGRSWMICQIMGFPVSTKKKIKFVLPLVSGFFWSIGTGGRQALGLILLYFVIGGAFGIGWVIYNGNSISKTSMFRIAKKGMALFIIFAIFIGVTGLSRAKQQGAAASAFDEIWYIAPVGQLVSYMGLTIATHQAYGDPQRRDLSKTGPVSLAGLQDFGIRYITGWKALTVEDTNPERFLAGSGQVLASATRDVFYDLQADFGFTGAIIAVILLVLISCVLFDHTRHAGYDRIVKLAPLVMMIMFWGYSHQFSLLMHNTLFWLILSFSVWDICRAFIVNRERLGDHK